MIVVNAVLTCIAKIVKYYSACNATLPNTINIQWLVRYRRVRGRSTCGNNCKSIYEVRWTLPHRHCCDWKVVRTWRMRSIDSLMRGIERSSSVCKRHEGIIIWRYRTLSLYSKSIQLTSQIVSQSCNTYKACYNTYLRRSKLFTMLSKLKTT